MWDEHGFTQQANNETSGNHQDWLDDIDQPPPPSQRPVVLEVRRRREDWQPKSPPSSGRGFKRTQPDRGWNDGDTGGGGGGSWQKGSSHHKGPRRASFEGRRDAAETSVPTPISKVANPFFQYINATPPNMIPARIFELCSKTKENRYWPLAHLGFCRASDGDKRVRDWSCRMYSGLEVSLRSCVHDKGYD